MPYSSINQTGLWRLFIKIDEHITPALDCEKATGDKIFLLRWRNHVDFIDVFHDS